MRDVESRIVNIQELSRILNVPVATMYYYKNAGMLPFFKVGKHLRFDLDEVINHFHPTRLNRNGSLKTRDAGHESPKKEDNHGN